MRNGGARNHCATASETPRNPEKNKIARATDCGTRYACRDSFVLSNIIDTVFQTKNLYLLLKTPKLARRPHPTARREKKIIRLPWVEATKTRIKENIREFVPCRTKLTQLVHCLPTKALRRSCIPCTAGQNVHELSHKTTHGIFGLGGKGETPLDRKENLACRDKISNSTRETEDDDANVAKNVSAQSPVASATKRLFRRRRRRAGTRTPINRPPQRGSAPVGVSPGLAPYPPCSSRNASESHQFFHTFLA